MRFPCYFRRQYGGASSDPLLGSDPTPSPSANGTNATNPPTPELAVSTDCQLSTKARDRIGAPVQKIAVLYGYTGSGTAPALTASLWFLEENSGLWFLGDTAAKALNKGGVTYFDAIPISDPPAFGGGASPGATPDALIYAGVSSSLRYYLQVQLVGTSAGVYTFGMAPVLASTP